MKEKIPLSNVEQVSSPEQVGKRGEMTAEESRRILGQLADTIPGAERFRRAQENGKEVIYSKEGEKFFISKLNAESKESFAALGQEVKEFNDGFFDPEDQCEPEEYAAAMRDHISDFYAVRNEKGELVSLLNTQMLDMQKRRETPEMAMLVWYVATKEEYRSKGLSTEIYRAAYRDAADASEKKSAAVYGIFGETEDEVERYLNQNFGRKRAYIETSKGNVEELLYLCPPSAYGTKGIPSHFMARLLDGREGMDASEYLWLTKSIYAEYTRPEYFEEDEPGARERFSAKVDKMYNQILRSTERAKDGKIFFMTQAEKEERKRDLAKKGKTLKETKT